MPEHTELEIDSVISRQNVAKEGWTTYYVDGSNGNDGANGLRWETAFKTIQAAVDKAESWAKIYIRNGTYNELVTVSKNFVSLIGESRDSVIIEPTSSGDALTLSGNDITITSLSAKAPATDKWCVLASGNRVTIDNIAIDGPDRAFGISIDHSWNANVTRVYASNANLYFGIKLWYAHFANVHDNYLNLTRAAGYVINFEWSSTSKVFNNDIGSLSMGILMGSHATDCSIYHNNFLGNDEQIVAYNVNNKYWENFYDDHSNTDNGFGIATEPCTFTGGSDPRPVIHRNGWLGLSWADADLPAIILKKSTTTSIGNVAKTTLIDSALTEATDNYWSGTVVILSGDCKGQKRDIASFAGGTITVGSAFAFQIVSGVEYAIVAFEPATVEVAALEADVGDASASTLGSLYGILGNPSHSLAATILDGIDARTNNPTLNALLGIPDAAGKSINGNIGDFQAQTHLSSLLAALGIPDTLNKPLYTCLITDRLDHDTFGLSALDTDLGTIITDTEKLYDAAFGVSPVDGSLASFIATGGTALGTRLPASKSLYDVIALDRLDDGTYGLAALNTYLWDKDISAYTDAKAGTYLRTLYDDWIDSGRLDLILDNIEAQTEERVVGKPQTKVISVTAAANAAADTVLGTVTNQGGVIDSIVIHANAAQTADLTSCPVKGGAAKVITFIGAGDATQANLDAVNKQVGWTGVVYLPVGGTIVMEHNGTGATALDLTAIITYHSTVSGGYLA